MKRVIINVALFVSAIMFAASCNTRSNNEHNAEKEDSKEAAEDLNEEKFPKSGEDKDAEFAVKAADGGMLEVKLGELAQTKGNSKQVKELGKMLVEDHSKANEELKAFAQAKDISLPTSMSDECQKMYDKIASKDGKDFDQAFTDHMVKDHKKDIDAFKKEAEKGHDPDIRQWASGKVQTLEHHLDMAKSAEDAADKEKKSTGKL
jgi:putative membrane protein